MEEKRVVIKCVDMREDLQREAILSATEVRGFPPSLLVPSNVDISRVL